MKTSSSLIEDRIRGLKVIGDTTIQDLYTVAYSEVGDKYAKIGYKNLRQDLKSKVWVPQYYKSLLYSSKKSLTLPDDTFKCVLILISKGYITADKCKYSGSVAASKLREAITELICIEFILRTIFEDEHNDQDLLNLKYTEAYENQIKVNKNGKTREEQRIKNLQKAILGYVPTKQEIDD